MLLARSRPPLIDLSDSADVSVIVTPAGQDAGVDELAQVLAARFGAPALRLRIELQRGGAEVARLPLEHAEHVASELRALGFDVHVGRDAGSVRRMGRDDDPNTAPPQRGAAPAVGVDPAIGQTRFAPGPAMARDATVVAAPDESPTGTMVGLPSKTDSFERRIDEMWGPAARGEGMVDLRGDDSEPVVQSAGRGPGTPIRPVVDTAEPADAHAAPSPPGPAVPGPAVPGPAVPGPAVPAPPPRVPVPPAIPAPKIPPVAASAPAFDPNATHLDPAWERVEKALAAAGVEPGTSSVPGDPAESGAGVPAHPGADRGADARAAFRQARPWDRGVETPAAPEPPSPAPPAAAPAPSPSAGAPERRGWAAVLGEDIPSPDPAPPPPPSAPGADDDDPGVETATMLMPNAPHATPRPSRRGHDALDALSANPPLDAEARYERLKGGVERDERSPALAAAWSLLAPGAGQAYNGERGRAVTFALAGVFVLPWVLSVVDAVRVAGALREGKRRGKPQATKLSLTIVAGWWVFVVVAALGIQAIDRATTRPVIVVDPPTVDSPAGSGVADDPEDPNPVPEVDRGPAEHRAEIRRQVDALVLEARRACAAGRCEECVRLVEEALELDESSRAAQQLHVEAVTAIGSGASCRDVGQRTGD